HLFSVIGITSQYIQDNQKGMAALEQITKYKSEVIAGDLLVIKSKIIEVTSKTLRFLHIMLNAETEKEAATSELLGVHLDRLKRKSCIFPQDIKAKCENFAKG
ncbi:MAG: thioesterase family protein, partial [Desulfobacterales bacterium]|nr:thioesterase family protein [Desulfobacterales bacterium]